LEAAFAANYPDQHYTLREDSLCQRIESSDGMVVAPGGRSLRLADGRTDGFVILQPQTAAYPFNQGLPSWNGTSDENQSAFKIQMRFPRAGGWSAWLTVGYWKANLWGSFGATSYDSGKVDVDYVTLSSYVTLWQFKIIMTRTSVSQPSPTLHKLSFFVSDSRTTSTFDFTAVLNDNPQPVFIPTTFVYQYGVDPEIGESICSPTSVSMILKSYGIAVDPYTFAQATYDPYYGIFGGWPRVVQNASQYGLDGAVTRYRTWSVAQAVLAAGGRIAMSVGKPLYTGHLLMLAGFTAAGAPIVHDPAKSNGYSYVFNKSDLSHSWFDKGGFAYTFYPAPTVASVRDQMMGGAVPGEFHLIQNYPNPFNPTTKLRYFVGGVVAPSGSEGPESGHVKLGVYDLLGREVAVLVDDNRAQGMYEVAFDGSRLASGVYLCIMDAGGKRSSIKMILTR
jgi:hypothetical protein